MIGQKFRRGQKFRLIPVLNCKIRLDHHAETGSCSTLTSACTGVVNCEIIIVNTVDPASFSCVDKTVFRHSTIKSLVNEKKTEAMYHPP